MKIAWTTLAILAGIGILCCGGVFVFAWGSFRLSLRANRGAEAWAAVHFPEIARQWDAKAWIAVDQPGRLPDQPQIETMASGFRQQYGDLVSVDPFVATNTYIVTSSQGLEFTVTLRAKAVFVKGSADVTFIAHHAMSKWTLQSLALKRKSEEASPVSLQKPNRKLAFVS